MINVYNETQSTREALKNVELVAPKNAGRNWKGIQHGDLIETITEAVIGQQGEVIGEKFSLSENEADLAGAFELKFPEPVLPGIDGQNYALGFITSNNRRKTLTMSVGTEVFCCNNGMITGEIVLNMRHVKGHDFVKEINDALGRYMIKAQEIKNMIEIMRTVEVTKSQAHDILFKAGHAKITNWTNIGKVESEFFNPTFAEHGKESAWALYNAFTYNVQSSHPHLQMEKMNKFRQLLPSEIVLAV